MAYARRSRGWSANLLLCRRLAAIIEGWPDVAPEAANPMENALYEMWGRLIDTMPAWWIRHRTRLWSDYLIAHLSEAGTRSDGRPPAFKDYLRQRRLEQRLSVVRHLEAHL